jgi:hypothetical protein
MEMILKSKRFALALLAGAFTGIVLVIFLRPACWAVFFGVFIASYLARASTLKDGAMVGAIVMIPIGISPTVVTIMQSGMPENVDFITSMSSMLLGIALMSGIRAVAGLIIGKMLEISKNKIWFI